MEVKTSNADIRTLCLDTLFCDECEETVHYALKCTECDMNYCEVCDKDFHQGDLSKHKRAGLLHDPEALSNMEHLKHALEEADAALVQDEAELTKQAIEELQAEETLLQALTAGQSLTPEQVQSLKAMIQNEDDLPPLPDDSEDSTMEDN
jgi:Na+-translocating ferredoxin:NAD+ oxidoreductase RnfC subunit